MTHERNTSLLHSSSVLQEWPHNVPTAQCPHTARSPISPALPLLSLEIPREKDSEGLWHWVGPLQPTPALRYMYTCLGPKNLLKVICKEGPWSIIFPSPTDLPSSSMNVSRRDNKHEDISMAISNHQATSNSPNTHQIQHLCWPIHCFTNHFTMKDCTKPKFYPYQPKICNAFTRAKLFLSIFVVWRDKSAQLLSSFIFHYKAKIRTLQESVMLKYLMTN